MEEDMAKGFERLSKAKGFFTLHRDLVDCAIDCLNDPEFKLWVVLATSSNDFRTPTKGMIEVTISQIRERLIWSQGKSSDTFRRLREKSFAKRIKRGLYYIVQTLAEVQSSELPPRKEVQNDEPQIQPSEHFTHSNELSRHEQQSYKDDLSFTSNSPSQEDKDLAKEIEEIFGSDFKEGT